MKTPFSHLQVQTRGTDESACAESITVKSDGIDRQAVGTRQTGPAPRPLESGLRCAAGVARTWCHPTRVGSFPGCAGSPFAGFLSFSVFIYLFLLKCS